MALPLRIRGDQIYRSVGIELVHFILAVNDGNIPLQRIDKDLLAVAMHRFQRCPKFRAIVRRYEVDHLAVSGDSGRKRRRSAPNATFP